MLGFRWIQVDPCPVAECSFVACDIIVIFHADSCSVEGLQWGRVVVATRWDYDSPVDIGLRGVECNESIEASAWTLSAKVGERLACLLGPSGEVLNEDMKHALEFSWILHGCQVWAHKGHTVQEQLRQLGRRQRTTYFVHSMPLAHRRPRE
ncbi:hypothetical protein BDW62DRAFT_195680 [Aspergillus aurantiobrunneus]